MLRLMQALGDHFEVGEEVASALAERRPVVALESAVISHGLPRPLNLETALAVEAAVREHGALPATIGLGNGRVRVGLTPQEIEGMATRDDVTKVSQADVSGVLASGALGGTTVATTAWAASRAGIRVMATGGIGGVHRDLDACEPSWDVSADLATLGHTPIAVVCAGAKTVLDLPRTLEALETYGVPVIGVGTDRFPGFYSVDSGLGLEHSVGSLEELARWIAIQDSVGLEAAIVVTQPPPADSALDLGEVEGFLARALEEAKRTGVKGKAVTPFLLSRLAELSDGRTLVVNRALLESNAVLAAQLAKAMVV